MDSSDVRIAAAQQATRRAFDKGTDFLRDSYFLLRCFGMALCFAWTFCLLPATGEAFPLPSADTPSHAALVRFVAVGVPFGFALPFFGCLFDKPTRRLSAFITGAALCVAGVLAGTLLAQALDESIALFIAVLLAGCGATLHLVYWGVSLADFDTAHNETAFITTFAMVGLLIVGYSVAPVTLRIVALCGAPLLELPCYIYAMRDPKTQLYTEIPDYTVHADSVTDLPTNDVKALVATITRTVIAVSLISFVWALFADGMSTIDFRKLSIFGLGILLGAVCLGLFSRYSPDVGFGMAARATIPVMAGALALCINPNGHCVLLACLILAAAHSLFENVLRLHIVRLSQKIALPTHKTIGWGYAAIMVGAFVGDTVYRAFFSSTGGFDPPHLAYVLALLAILTVPLMPMTIWRREDASEEATPAAQGIDTSSYESSEQTHRDATSRALVLSQRFGLTGRETQICRLLLEGRSRPYIRDELMLSISTVDTHVRHIYEKTSVTSLQQLIDLSMLRPESGMPSGASE